MSETAAAESMSPRNEIVSFTIGDQAFSIDIQHVLEIRGWTTTTVLPHAPDYVIGMMNLRGTVLPVVDLSLRLGLGRTKPDARHVIIIARIRDKTVGFLVDTVSDIVMVREGDMQPTPEVSSQRTHAFIRGVFTINETLVRAIDVERVLPAEDASAA